MLNVGLASLHQVDYLLTWNCRPQPASPPRPLAIHRTLNAEQPTLPWPVRIIAVWNRASPSQSVSVTGNNGKKKVHFVAALCHTVGRIGIAVTKPDPTPMLLDTEVQKPATAGLDIRALLREHEGRNYELHHEHVNPCECPHAQDHRF